MQTPVYDDVIMPELLLSVLVRVLGSWFVFVCPVSLENVFGVPKA